MWFCHHSARNVRRARARVSVCSAYIAHNPICLNFCSIFPFFYAFAFIYYVHIFEWMLSYNSYSMDVVIAGLLINQRAKKCWTTNSRKTIESELSLLHTFWWFLLFIKYSDKHMIEINTHTNTHLFQSGTLDTKSKLTRWTLNEHSQRTKRQSYGIWKRANYMRRMSWAPYIHLSFILNLRSSECKRETVT